METEIEVSPENLTGFSCAERGSGLQINHSAHPMKVNFMFPLSKSLPESREAVNDC